MTLLDHRNTARTKKLDFKNSHLTSVGARYTFDEFELLAIALLRALHH
jgi:hypothetical protein